MIEARPSHRFAVALGVVCALMLAVAPGIAEALITTAFGIVVAVPAQVFYNHLATRARELATEMDNFTSEFLNIAERHFLS